MKWLVIEKYAFSTRHNTFSILEVCIELLTASVVFWSEFMAADPEAQIRFQALPNFLRSNGSGTGPTQFREYN
jgi:hypothetical protein